MNIDLKEKIAKMYIEGKSSSEIGNILNYSGTHILRIMKKCGVKRRSLSDGKKLSQNKPETIEKMRRSATGRLLSESTKDKLRLLVGENNANWKGGITKTAGGYLTYTNSPENKQNKNKLMHRVIAEKKIGRCLLPGEVVHHIDGDQSNNCFDNLLVLSSQAEHARIHGKERGALNYAQSM